MPLYDDFDGFRAAAITIRRVVVGAMIFLFAFMVLMYEVKIASDEQERPTIEETAPCGEKPSPKD